MSSFFSHVKRCLVTLLYEPAMHESHEGRGDVLAVNAYVYVTLKTIQHMYSVLSRKGCTLRAVTPPIHEVADGT